MRKDKTKSASVEKLFDAVGMIDDFIIAEAERPYVKPKRSFSVLTKTLALACSLVICVTVGLGVFLSSRVGDDDNADFSDSKNNAAMPDESFGTLSEYLSRIDESIVEIHTADEIDFFDGNTTLIWQFDGDEPQSYRTTALYDGYEDFTSVVVSLGRELSPDEAQKVSCKVWISYGNGEVVSPYLKASDGNVGYGELFEYSPEYEPNEKFMLLLENLIVLL